MKKIITLVSILTVVVMVMTGCADKEESVPTIEPLTTILEETILEETILEETILEETILHE